MALKLDITGYNIPKILKRVICLDNLTSAIYVKITTISGSKNRTDFICSLSPILNDDKNYSVGSSIANINYSFCPDLDSPDNFIKQGYEYLKTLPEFANCKDC